MKSFSLLLSIFLFKIIIGQNTFVKLAYSPGQSYSSRGFITKDTGLVLVGYDPDYPGYFIKFNKFGMLTWANFFDDLNNTGAGLSCGDTVGNTIFVTGGINAAGYLMALNSGGQKIWSRSFIPYNGSGYIVDITHYRNKLFLLYQMQDSLSQFLPMLITLDTSGNLINSVAYDAGRFPSDIVFDSLNSQLVFASQQNNGSFITAIDTAGNLMWQKFYDSMYINRVSYNSANELIYAGTQNIYSNYMIVLKANPSGGIIWSELIGDSLQAYSAYPTSLFIDRNGSIFIGNNSATPSIGCPPANVTKISSSGNIVWSMDYLPNSVYQTQVSGIDLISPNEFWISGDYNEKSFFISADSNGYVGCDNSPRGLNQIPFTIGDSSVVMPSESIPMINILAFDTISAIPFNQYFDCSSGVVETVPSNAEVNIWAAQSGIEIKINGSCKEQILLRVYSMLGAEVVSFSIPAGTNEITVPGTVAPGVYGYSLFSASGSQIQSGLLNVPY
jgi:hypothetical protein